MPRRKYDARQEAGLAALKDIHIAHTLAKAHLKAEIQRQYETKLADFEMQKSKEMNRLRGMDVAKSDLGRQIGTQNWETIERLLGLAVDFAAPEVPVAPVQILRFVGFQNLTGASRTTGAVWYEHEGKEFRAMLAYDIRDKRVDWSYAMHADDAIRPYIEEFVKELDPHIGEGGVVTNPTNVTRVEATEED